MIRFLDIWPAVALGAAIAVSPIASAQEAPRARGAAKAQGEGKPAAAAQKGKAEETPKSRAGAKGKGKGGAKAGPGGSQATLLATFGDWSAFLSQQGRSKVCYALVKPKEQAPRDLKRDPAYLFVSFRPAENVRNEIAVVLGFSTKDDKAEATIGRTTYALVAKGQNAWVQNPAEETQVVATMSRGQTLVVKALSKRGAKVSDTYSLSGFGPALERARKECS